MTGRHRRELVACLVGAALVAGSCTSATPVTTSTAAATQPATTKLELIDDCPNFLPSTQEVPEPSEATVTQKTQSGATRDRQIADDYGLDHPDSFGGARIVGTDDPRVLVGFTSGLERHCAELRDLLRVPDKFLVIRAPFTESGLQDVAADIQVMAGVHMQAVGTGTASGKVTVRLRADGEAVAESIVDRYGDLVEVTLGRFSYPDRVAETPCRGLIPPEAFAGPIPTAVVQLGTDDIESGGDFKGVVTITNNHGEAFHLESGSPLSAVVVRLGTTEVIGTGTGFIAGVGVVADLAPGESIDIDVTGGTASCDPELGYALPPGMYEVRVKVNGYIVSEPAALEITA